MGKRQSLAGGPARLAAALALALGACSMERTSELFSKPQLPTFELNPYSRATAAAAVNATAQVLPSDLVNAEGSCEGIGQDGTSGQAGATGIALQMTECSLVRLIGSPEKLEMGADERGDRAVTMLYSRGERPGLYRFTAGRLTSIDRVAEPPPPPKPQKPAPQAKPRRAT